MVNDNDIKLASVGGSAEQANDVKTVMHAARTAYNNGDMIVTPNWDVYFVENGSPVLKGNIKGATGKDGSPGAKGEPGKNGASTYTCTSVIDSDGSTLVSSIMSTGRSIAVGDMLVSSNNGGIAQVDSVSGNNVNYTYVGSIKGAKGDTGAAGKNGAPGSKIYFGEV